MVYHNALELAVQGNLATLEALLNSTLKPKGITAKVGFKESCLFVSLVSAQVPAQQELVSFIREQITSIGAVSLSKIKIYGRQLGQNSPAWYEEIELAEFPTPAMPCQTPEAQAIAPLVQTRNPSVTQEAQLKLSAQTSVVSLATKGTTQVPATPSSPEFNHLAQVIGEVGQLIVGNYNIQIGSIHGGVVNFISPEQQPRLRPRATPVFFLPRPFPQLLGRKGEVNAAIASFQATQSVEFYSQPGLGKTVLLRYLAYHPQVTSPFPHGAVNLWVTNQPVTDLLQSLFDAFYESDITYKPTDFQICQLLQNKQALILLDHQKLTPSELEELMNAVPGCTFLLASPERCLWGEGRAMMLHGLPWEDALALMERELARAFTAQERSAAQSLWQRLNGHPQYLLHAMGKVREEGCSLSEVVRQVTFQDSAKSLLQQILASLQERQRRILAVLAALGGVALLAQQAAALSEIPEAEAILENLVRRNLVQVDYFRYKLSEILVQTLPQEWNLKPWKAQALTFFKTWVQQHQNVPSRLLEETDAIFQTLNWGVEVGRWSDVLVIAKAVEGPLALSKRWGLWHQVLNWSLLAARSLSNPAAEAWALHQLGSRALCLEDLTTARHSLTQALSLREALGDEAGAAITRHNLSLIPAAPAPPRTRTAASETSSYRIAQRGLQGLVGLLLLMLVGALLWPIAPPLLPHASPPAKSSPSPSSSSSQTLNPIPKPPSASTPTLISSLSLSSDSLDFRRQAVGVPSQAQNITLTNSGSAVLLLTSSPQITGTDSKDFSIIDDSCQESIQPGESCQISIGFQPTATGKRNASLTITHKGVGRYELVPLTGEGVTPSRSPVAKNDTASTLSNTPIPINVLVNDRNPDGGDLILVKVTQPENGLVRINKDTILYQPKPEFVGIDQFTYTIKNAVGRTATATVAVKVDQAPQPLTAKDDTVTTRYNTPVNITVLANDDIPDRNSITVRIETPPQNGSATANTNGSITYQPNAFFPDNRRRFSGKDTFTYTISNGKGESAKATVTVTVEPPLQPLVAKDDAVTTRYNTPVNISVLANDDVPDKNNITVSIASPPQNGSVAVNGDNTVTYTPNAIFANSQRPFLGNDSFTYKISDRQGRTSTATVTVTVQRKVATVN